jgi:hypothetical protein
MYEFSDLVLTAVVTAAVLLVIFGVILLTRKGDPVARDLAARMQRDADFAQKVQALLQPPPPPKPSGEPLRLLALLQREGRLVDFLMTDNIQAADNDQIVVAVKDLQPKWKAALLKYLELGPVRPEPEQTTVEVPPGFDPSAVQLTGNVTGKPPFRGTLIHAGWRVQAIKVPKPPEGQDEFVVQPAEVELS